MSALNADAEGPDAKGPAARSPAASAIPQGFDPITFEVLSNAFTAVIEEMDAVIEKVAFSTVASEGHDYCSAIANTKGEVVSRGAGGLPLIGGTIGYRLQAILNATPMDDLREGDVILHNDPYLGGTHAQDVSAVVPVFWEGEFVAMVQTCSHWPDIGGPIPGSFNSEAESSHAEAMMIPPIHIARAGKWLPEVERLILRNVRIAPVIAGDLRGLTEAARMGEAQMHKLLRKYGKDVVLSAMDGFLGYTRKLLGMEFKKISGRTVTWTDHIDRDPGSDSDAPIPITLSFTAKGERGVVDFTGSGPQARGPVNCALSATSSAIQAVLKAIYPHIPMNDGFRQVIDIVTPEDCVVNAKYPAPVSGHAANSAEKIVSCMHGCFMQLTPDRAMCAPTNLVNISLFGVDSRPGRGQDYVAYIWLCGGWGGRSKAGDGGTYMMPLAAGTRLQFAEVLERVYPIRIEAYGLMPDSEGPGRHRGGFGLRFPFQITHGDFSVNTQGDREVIRNWGYAGGEPALGNKLVYAPGTPREESVGVMRAGFRAKAGVRLDYWQGGGGGHGPAAERDPAKVCEDVRAGLVSPARARDIYKVAVTVVDEELAHYDVDADATRALRAAPVAAE